MNKKQALKQTHENSFRSPANKADSPQTRKDRHRRNRHHSNRVKYFIPQKVHFNNDLAGFTLSFALPVCRFEELYTDSRRYFI